MKAFLSIALTFLCVSLLTFLALRLTPGDPVELLLGENGNAVKKEQLREKLGLNQPLPRQLAHYYGNLAQGSLGTSLLQDKPVTRLLGERLPFTLWLACWSLIATTLTGVGAGLLSVMLKGKTGKNFFWLALTTLAVVPSFWLAPLLVWAFGLRWPWLAISYDGHAGSLLLPVMTATLAHAASLALVTRLAVLETLRRDFIRTAFAKGASSKRVFILHILPNAAVPVLTVILSQFSHMLAGAVILETLFDWPGVGRLLFDAVLQRDYPVVQGVVLFTTLVYLTLNSVSDWFSKAYAARSGT